MGLVEFTPLVFSMEESKSSELATVKREIEEVKGNIKHAEDRAENATSDTVREHWWKKEELLRKKEEQLREDKARLEGASAAPAADSPGSRHCFFSPPTVPCRRVVGLHASLVLRPFLLTVPSPRDCSFSPSLGLIDSPRSFPGIAPVPGTVTDLLYASSWPDVSVIYSSGNKSTRLCHIGDTPTHHGEVDVGGDFFLKNSSTGEEDHPHGGGYYRIDSTEVFLLENGRLSVYRENADLRMKRMGFELNLKERRAALNKFNSEIKALRIHSDSLRAFSELSTRIKSRVNTTTRVKYFENSGYIFGRSLGSSAGQATSSLMYAFHNSSVYCAKVYSPTKQLQANLEATVAEAVSKVDKDSWGAVVKYRGVVRFKDGRVALMMPVYPRSLFDWQTSLPSVVETCWWDEIVREMILCLSRAILLLNEAGYCHCDIKPDNIMLKGDGGMVLIDLGSAVQVGSLVQESTSAYLLPFEGCETASLHIDVCCMVMSVASTLDISCDDRGVLLGAVELHCSTIPKERVSFKELLLGVKELLQASIQREAPDKLCQILKKLAA